jgi:hypothetical protein
MTKGELELAIRRALNLFDQWNDVTGYVPKASGYYYEIQCCIESAVHCGAQAATGDYKTIPDCDDENIQEFTPVGTDNDWRERAENAEAKLNNTTLLRDATKAVAKMCEQCRARMAAPPRCGGCPLSDVGALIGQGKPTIDTGKEKAALLIQELNGTISPEDATSQRLEILQREKGNTK